VLSDDQLAVVDELIDTMDLSTAGRYLINVNCYVVFFSVISTELVNKFCYLLIM